MDLDALLARSLQVGGLVGLLGIMYASGCLLVATTFCCSVTTSCGPFACRLRKPSNSNLATDSSRCWASFVRMRPRRCLWRTSSSLLVPAA